MTLSITSDMSIAIWGMGLEGRAAHDWLRERHGVRRLRYILNAPPAQAEIDYLLESDLDQLTAENTDLIVKSPGVSKYKPEVEALRARGIPLTSGTNLWFTDNPDAKTIVVTGTKGKSTVSSVLLHLLTQNGFDAQLAGNIGTPLLGSAPAGDVNVIEMSSYQTADLDAAPDFAVLTNLFEDHLIWHDGRENYHADKLRLLTRSAKTRGLASAQAAARRPLPDSVEVFDPTDYAITNDGRVTFGGETIATHFPLRGAHNLTNFGLAYRAAQMFAGRERLGAVVDFSDFETLPHRMSETNVGGVTLVDDSIATIPQAAISAMEVYGTPLHALIGGFDRGIDYAPLLQDLNARELKSLSFFGPVGQRISRDPALQRSDWRVTATLAEALENLRGKVTAGDTVLLSPAAPSLDEFENFKARGRFFIDTMSAQLG